MSVAPVSPLTEGVEPAVPRVRHQARDAATLMVFSAALSVGTAGFLLFLGALARQA
jgi:hypothetical protein